MCQLKPVIDNAQAALTRLRIANAHLELEDAKTNPLKPIIQDLEFTIACLESGEQVRKETVQL